jgi:transposase
LDLMDRATIGMRFRSYGTDVLVPALKPGDMVATDNPAADKVAGVRRAIDTAGIHRLYFLSYGVDFKRVVSACPKLNALLRKAAARTEPVLRAAIRDAFPSRSSRASAGPRSAFSTTPPAPTSKPTARKWLGARFTAGSDGEQCLRMTEAALRHPVLRVWKAHRQRAAF